MRFFKAAAITGGLAALAVGMSAAPAYADTVCPNNYVCMWEDGSYGGSKYVLQPANVGFYEIDGWDGDNEISSVKNTSGKCLRLYDNDGGGGSSYYIEPEGFRPNLNQNGFNDRAESYRIYNC